MGGKTAGAGAAPNPYLSGAVVAPGQAGGAAGVTGLRSSNLASALSGLGKKPNTPPTPQARPAPPPVPTGTGKLTTPAAPGTDPLLGRNPLTGALRAYGASVPGGRIPPGPGDGMAVPAFGGSAAPISSAHGGNPDDYNAAGEYDPLHLNRLHKTRAVGGT
jgi:hypothetical protein